MSKVFISIAALIALGAVIIGGISLSTREPASQNGSASSSAEAVLTLTAPHGGTVEVGALQHVRWTAENYVPATVAVNIIRKVSDNPVRYELVRTVAAATRNDGDAVWVPAATDAGTNTFVEVGCALSAQACRATAPTASLAVVDTGRYANTASAFQAIEQLNNK